MTDDELKAIEARWAGFEGHDATRLVAEVRRLKYALGETERFLPECIQTHGEPCDTGDCDIPDRGRRLLAEIRVALR